MASTRLVFTQPRHTTGNPVPLVFGAGAQGDVPRYAISARGRITLGLRGQVRAASVVLLQAKGRITMGLRGSVAARWNVNASRPVVGHTVAHFEAAQPVRAAVATQWQEAQALRAAVANIWRDARHVSQQVQALWQQAQPVRQHTVQLEQQAQGVRAGVASSYQEAQRLRAGAAAQWQDGLAVRAMVANAYQEAARVRGRTVSVLEQGQRVSAQVLGIFAHGTPLRVGWLAVHQDAAKPGSGRWQQSPPMPPKPCYVPGLPARLVFKKLYTGSSNLLFCCCTGEQPAPVARYEIPLLQVYMQVHTLNAHLLPGLEPVQLTNVTISTDADSYCWSLSATGPEHLMEQLAPVAGMPARLQVVIDGMAFVFAVRSTSRARAFGQRRVQVQGMSVTSLLTDPYMPAQVWSPTADFTAQQLALQALEYTGVDLQWGIDDWLVPAGAYSYQGTPLQAVQRVAASVGAVLASHRTQDKLIVLPRYPVLPWGWASATADVQMPADVIVTDDLQPEPRADYNAIYVTGGPVGGVQAHVVRALSARDKLAQQIQDDLITHAAAARMRGSWALAASGNKLIQTINMPVRTGGTNPGVLEPGQLLQVNDTDGTWRGLVRGVSVSAALPKVRQQVTVERVAA